MNKKVTLELVGLDGNAFSIMGAFRRQAQKENWINDEIQSVLDEAMSGDYNHLLCTIMKYCESPEHDEDDVCPDCYGDGEFEEEYWDEETDEYEVYYETCWTCGGTGVIEGWA